MMRFFSGLCQIPSICWLLLLTGGLSMSVSAQQPAMSNARTQIRMQLTPAQETVLSSEIAGRLSAVTVKEGASFQQGDTLMSMDCQLHQARLQKAQAQAEEAQKVLTVNEQLDRLGSISVLEVDIASARLSAAQAEANLMQGIAERCIIKAPFSGKVAELLVNAHQFVAEGQQLMAIVDDSELDVEMVVPSRWLSQLSVGQSFSLQVDETGNEYPAQIDRFGATIDAVSQSVKVFASISGEHPELKPGMSGTAILIND